MPKHNNNNNNKQAMTGQSIVPWNVTFIYCRWKFKRSRLLSQMFSSFLNMYMSLKQLFCQLPEKSTHNLFIFKEV